MNAFLPYLRSLLYKWEYRPFLDTASPDYVGKLKLAYTPDEYAMFVHSLEWAALNAEYPFSSLLEGVKATDAEIYAYFSRLLALMR